MPQGAVNTARDIDFNNNKSLITMDLQTVLRKSNLADGSGKGKVYATLVRYSTITTDELMRYMLQNSHVGAGEARRVVEGLLEQFRTFLPNGHSIKIDGLGTFSLRMRSEVEKDKNGKYVLKNPRIDKVNFVPDKRLLHELSKITFCPPMADLTNVRHFSEAEAEELALRMLGNASYFFVEDYAIVAGVSKATAYRRLKQLVQRGVIAESGSRRRKFYVKA